MTNVCPRRGLTDPTRAPVLKIDATMTLIPRHSVRRSARLVLAFIATIILVAGRGSGHLGLFAGGRQSDPGREPAARRYRLEHQRHRRSRDSRVRHRHECEPRLARAVQGGRDPAAAFHLDIVRTGQYHGAGARRVASIENSWREGARLHVRCRHRTRRLRQLDGVGSMERSCQCVSGVTSPRLARSLPHPPGQGGD